MARRRLDAWKEIAQYLGRDVTTVRRWEKREGLPVHRHLHDKLGSVYAYTDEIDAWSAARSIQAAPAAVAARPEPPAPIKTDSLESRPSPVVVAARHSRLWRLSVSLAGLSAIVFATISPWAPPTRAKSDRAKSDPPLMKVALPPPPDTIVESLVISPDGQQVAFAGGDATGTRLWIRRIDSSKAEPIPGTDGAVYPFWSPDSQHVGFFAGGWMKRVALSTREIRDIAPAAKGYGGTWNDRGVIVFAANVHAPLSQVLASGGGQVTRVTTPVGVQVMSEGQAWPEFLPDGRHVIYTDYARFGIYVVDIETKVTKFVLRELSSACYSRDGYLLYVKGSLMARPFDLARLEVSGAAVPIAEQVRVRYDLGFKGDFSVSHTNFIAVRSAGVDQNRLAWIDRRKPKEATPLGEPSWYGNPTLSPDGKKLLTTVNYGAGADNLWMFEEGISTPKRVTLGGQSDFAPVISPGSDRVIFVSKGGLYEKTLLDGTNPTPVLQSTMSQLPDSWSLNGRYLSVTTINPGPRFDVWAWRLDGNREMFPVATSAAKEGQSQISPDEQFIAYTSDESGQVEVWVQSFPTPTNKWQVTSGGGAEPKWARNGTELFYIGANRRMMAMPVKLRPRFTYGPATPLFEMQVDDIFMGDTRNHYDVTPDSQRFIVITPKTDKRLAPFTLLANWR